MRILTGLDIGNGYVKGDAVNMENGHTYQVDIPSSVAYVTKMNDIPTPVSEAGDVIKDIFNNMDVTFDSVLVEDTARRLFGDRGLHSGLSLEEFDVYSHVSKCQQDLSGILILGSIAGMALQEYWNTNHALPKETIKVQTRVALALPIREYKKYRKQYAERLKSGQHLVTFHNFEDRVRVEISFEDTQVLAEGASAQYAIKDKGEKFIAALLGETRKLDPDFNAEITAADVAQAPTIIGIDIGEGTVNFPVFQNNKFNTDASMTFDKGWGSVLNQALERLQDDGFSFKSRKELADYIEMPVTPLNKGAKTKVLAIIYEEIVAFVQELNMQFVKVMSRIGAYVEVVYVYGGGATRLRPVLHKKLIETGKQFGGEYPILYMESSYSRKLNREGLMYIAKLVAESAAPQVAPKSDAQAATGAA